MTDLMPPAAPAFPRPMILHREGTEMLLHEALARARQREAQQAAREYALARRFTAGRRWASLAGFAARRAELARAAADAIPVHRDSGTATSGLRGALR